MTPFEHLAVLVSIVLGLGLTHLLASVHKVVQARRRVRLYALPLVWVALIFVSQIEWWWALFALRATARWNFFYFLFVLLSPVSLYLASAFALPDIERGEEYDLRAYYYDNRAWFFGTVAAGPALDAVRRGVEAGTWRDFGSFTNAISAALLLWLCVTRRTWAHVCVTLLTGGLFLYFIVSSALELR
jgi:hypothetical protein